MKNSLIQGKRGFQLVPGYDYRSNHEMVKYGQHPPEMYFFVQGDKGAVVATVSTGWYLDGKVSASSLYANIAYHEELTIQNSSENEYCISDNCEYLEGRACCGHTIYVTDFLTILREQGLDGIYEKLESLYLENFGEPV